MQSRSSHITLLKTITAIVMCGCLVLLTGINFFLFNGTERAKVAITVTLPDEETPATPVEDNLPENKPAPLLQEFIPTPTHNITVYNQKANHCLHQAGQLHIVYFDIVVPPPKV